MRIAVIGAGAAGLVTARELQREGLAPVLFEQASRLGGTWIYGAQSPLYASLRTNLPRDLMAFDDFPFVDQGGGDPRRFPGHAEVLRYLEAFARAASLGPRSRMRAIVDEVSPRDADDQPWTAGTRQPVSSWHIRWHDPGAPHVDTFDAIAICNGHYSEPSMPEIPGLPTFAGRVVHSCTYRDPQPFAGKTVALLGAKSSGIDLSIELAEVARRVILCGRGLARADRLGPRHNLDHRPAIASVHAHGLRLVDGSEETDVDALVLCTGYRYRFPFLDPAAGLLDDPCDQRPFPLHLDLISAYAETLAFVGLPFQIVPFPLFERQARLWARVLSAKVALPDAPTRLREARERDAHFAAAGVPLRHRMRLGPAQFAYNADLSRLAGDPPPARFREPLNRIVAEARRRDPANYRDTPFLSAIELGS